MQLDHCIFIMVQRGVIAYFERKRGCSFSIFPFLRSFCDDLLFQRFQISIRAFSRYRAWQRRANQAWHLLTSHVWELRNLKFEFGQSKFMITREKRPWQWMKMKGNAWKLLSTRGMDPIQNIDSDESLPSFALGRTKWTTRICPHRSKPNSKITNRTVTANQKVSNGLGGCCQLAHIFLCHRSMNFTNTMERNGLSHMSETNKGRITPQGLSLLNTPLFSPYPS